MSTNGKSGYEIRADLLGLASGVLQQNRQQHESKYHCMLETVQDKSSITYPEVALAAITAQDIISAAKQFNEFVNEKA